MTKLTLQGKEINTNGTLPKVGTIAPDFTYVKTDLSEGSLYSTKGKFKLLNIFPSIDTGTCAMSVRSFNQNASEVYDATVINLSLDLPFAQKRFCGAEGINKVETGSLFRSNFLKNYPIDFSDGPLKGLTSRVVMIINDKNEVVYTEQVSEIANEPNYAAAFKALH